MKRLFYCAARVGRGSRRLLVAIRCFYRGSFALLRPDRFMPRRQSGLVPEPAVTSTTAANWNLAGASPTSADLTHHRRRKWHHHLYRQWRYDARLSSPKQT